MPIFYTFCFFLGSFLQLHYFVLNDWDFSYFLTQAWRVGQGIDWNVPFAEAVDGAPFYAHHFTPLSALLAPILRVFPSEYTLSAIHALSVSSVAFLLPRIIRQIYGTDIYTDKAEYNAWLWTSACILVIFFFYRPFIAAWSRQMHYTTIVTPFLALGILCLHKRLRLCAISCAFMLCLGQERASVAVFGLGLYAWLLLGERRMGVFFCVLSLLWFFCATQIALPWLRTYAGVADTTYPFLQRLGITIAWPEKLAYLFWLCAFSCFLPFCGKKALKCAACAIPTTSLSLLSRASGLYDMRGQYDDLASIFLLLSMAYGMRWLQKKSPSFAWLRSWQRLFGIGTCTYALIILLSTSGWYTPLLTCGRLLSSEQKSKFDLLNTELARFKSIIPENARLYVQSGLGPRLALYNGRTLLTARELNSPLSNSIIVLSPLAGDYLLNAKISEAIKKAEAHPNLVRLGNQKDLYIFVSKDLADKTAQF